MKAFSVLLFLLFINLSFAQKKVDPKMNKDKFNMKLINDKQQGREIAVWLNETDNYTGKYLGKVKTKSGKEYYILTSAFWYNLNLSKRSPHVESHIYIYNTKKQYVGCYCLGNMFEAPKKVSNNKLYLKQYDCKNTVIVDFENAVPEKINLKCDGVNEFLFLSKD